MFGWRESDVLVRLCHGIGSANYHQEDAGSDWKHLEIPCEHFKALPVQTVSSKYVETVESQSNASLLTGLLCVHRIADGETSKDSEYIGALL